MKNKLQNYFPMIRTQGEVLDELRENTKLWKTFCEWEEKYQQEYLDICTGVKGVKLLYDTYFKAVMNPDTRPERLNDFLSEILGKKVKILKIQLFLKQCYYYFFHKYSFSFRYFLSLKHFFQCFYLLCCKT